jgi:hypothetical protein
MLHAITICLSIVVLLTSGCRLIHMSIKTHKTLWVAFFACIALGALAAGFEATQGRAAWPQVGLLLGAALYLLGSRDNWRAGAPSFMLR